MLYTGIEGACKLNIEYLPLNIGRGSSIRLIFLCRVFRRSMVCNKGSIHLCNCSGNQTIYCMYVQCSYKCMTHYSIDNSVGFPTNPKDSTGVAHILEHTALCGSKRFPVRDPFFKMLTRSLATFMNAFTGICLCVLCCDYVCRLDSILAPCSQ